jgi:hypothetical protein
MKMKEQTPQSSEDRSEELGQRLNKIMTQEQPPKTEGVVGANNQENISINERIAAEGEKLEAGLKNLDSNVKAMPDANAVEKIGAAATRPLSGLSERMYALRDKWQKVYDTSLVAGALGGMGIFAAPVIEGMAQIPHADSLEMFFAASGVMVAGMVGTRMAKLGSRPHQVWERKKTYNETIEREIASGKIKKEDAQYERGFLGTGSGGSHETRGMLETGRL